MVGDAEPWAWSSLGENCFSVEIKGSVAASHLPVQPHYVVQPMQILSHHGYFQSCGNHPATRQILLQTECGVLYANSSAAKGAGERMVGRPPWACFALIPIFFFALYGHLQPVCIEAAAGLPCLGTASPDSWSSWRRTQGIQLKAVIHHYNPTCHAFQGLINSGPKISSSVRQTRRCFELLAEVCCRALQPPGFSSTVAQSTPPCCPQADVPLMVNYLQLG